MKRKKSMEARAQPYTLCYHTRMTPFEIALGVFVVLGLGTMIAMQMKRPQIMGSDYSKDVTRLEKDLENEKAQKNKLDGENRQIRDELAGMKSEFSLIKKEKEKLNDELTDLRVKYRSEKIKLEEERKQQEKGADERYAKLEAAEKSFKEEKQRVIREDEERMKRLEEERDRQWKEHEIDVISSLTELCKQPYHQFTSFSNKNLPIEFDGSLEPDFMIELFKGEYVIFDAKANKARGRIQAYIDEQIKKTTTKLKNKGGIYPHVFLVVPMEGIGEIKKHVIKNGDFLFYIVSKEALSPILAALKRISGYQLAEKLDPQKRENIVNALADLATHVSFRNAFELVMSKMGIETLERVAKTDPELAIEVSKAEKKFVPTASEIKRLANDIAEQNIEIASFAAPKASVKKSMIEAAQSVISQKLL